MLDTQFIKNLTDLRLDPAKVTKLAENSNNPVYIFNRSRPISVLLNIKLYQELVEKLEDALDALEMKAFEKKPKNKNEWMNHEELLNKLRNS